MEFLLTNVNDWLKHAEGKHAVLVGLNIGIIGFVTHQCNFNEWDWSILNIYFLWMIILMTVSIVCSVFSFLPRLKPPNFKTIKDGQTNSAFNPLYFADVAKIEPKQLVLYFKKEEEIEEKEIWLANQIISNSQIAVIKYKLFKAAVWFSFFAIFPSIALLSGLIRFIVKCFKGGEL